jgi:hypothetical protein
MINFVLQLQGLRVGIDHDLAGGGVIFECAIGFANGRQLEMPGIDPCRDLAGFDQPCRFAQDVAVMRAALA